MANEYSILNEIRRSPQRALDLAVQRNLYERTPATNTTPAALTPAGRDAFYNDLTAPFEQTPNGGSRLTPRQRQIVELARNDYNGAADNRLSGKRWGVGIALAGAAVCLTFLIGNTKPSDNFIKQRQNNYQTANERHRYFTGRDAPWYNSSKTLEDNLKDVKTDAQKDRKGGRGLFYFLGGLGLLAGLYGLVGYKIRKNAAAQAAQQAAQAAAAQTAQQAAQAAAAQTAQQAAQAATPAPAVPAPAAPAPAAPPNPAPAAPAPAAPPNPSPAAPAPAAPAPAVPAPVPPNQNPNAPAPIININYNYYNTPPPNP
jgi:hypothetical protein